MAHHIHAKFEDSHLRRDSKSWFQSQSHSVDFSMGLAYPSWGFKKK
jgi:hypothetical protein